ncbi:hypothetical protein HYX00_01270 [Candidatus Woesearchaeota archaeon]|nr:hypothetical protein [Candidatus Woesearchaeota archaeon]
MKIYFDTTIANDAYILTKIYFGEKYSSHYKKDLKFWKKEYVALYFLLDLDNEWELEFLTSPMMKEEINKYQNSRKFNLELYSYLLNFYNMLIEKIEFTPLNIGKESIKEIKLIGLKEIDTLHICHARKLKCNFFITTDKNTIIKYKNKLEKFGIKVRLPSEFIEENFINLNTLIRALYGSWISSEKVFNFIAKDITKYSTQPTSKLSH